MSLTHLKHGEGGSGPAQVSAPVWLRTKSKPSTPNMPDYWKKNSRARCYKRPIGYSQLLGQTRRGTRAILVVSLNQNECCQEDPDAGSRNTRANHSNLAVQRPSNPVCARTWRQRIKPS